MFAKQFNVNGFHLWDGALTAWIIGLSLGSACAAADRTTCYVPMASDQKGSMISTSAVFPDQAMGGAASVGWKSYLRLWRAHHDDPADKSIRQYLGLPLSGSVQATSRRGRSAPRELQWAAGSYQQIDTPHFTIYSHADEQVASAVAEDLERCYWIWTQMFFPLWESSAQVTTTLAKLGDQDVADFLSKNKSRITIRRKLRVVLFRDSAEYYKTLGGEVPGVERSTGFYNDDMKLTFLFASPSDADSLNDGAETRRHELVHQLFREATRSTLGKRKPAEGSEFWIIEGIAGYFESLRVAKDNATVGGWDSERLQFARYRMLSGGDVMPIAELRADGRVAAQKRGDIARWYAHAIAQTHHFMDGGEVGQRIGIYQILGRQYAIKANLSGGQIAPGIQRRLQRFLTLTDQRLGEAPIDYSLKQLCLSQCQVTAEALSTIPPTEKLEWLDLSRLPIGNESVTRLAPNPASVEQLTLEATKVDSGLNSWLGKASGLQELDLSWTPMNDQTIAAIAPARNLQVLWMTGTKVTDKSIDVISKMPNLQSVDLQRTSVTEAGIARLKAARSNLRVNPLELRAPQ